MNKYIQNYIYSPKDASAKIVTGNIVVYEEHKGQAVNKENLKDIIVYKLKIWILVKVKYP